MSHRSSSTISVRPVTVAPPIGWGEIKTTEEWLKEQPVDAWKESFSQNGFLVVKDMLSEEEVNTYKDVYTRMLSGDIDTKKHRHDLGNHRQKKTQAENICQIMWPSVYVEKLKEEGPIHKRALAVSRIILGEDMEFDFDFLISKCALDKTTVDNGCMWFVPGSHLQPLRSHRPVQPYVHVLMCDGIEEEAGVPQPLSPGSATFHHGKTIHYSRGNSTDTHRRAFSVVFRPKAMVEEERKMNVDFGKIDGFGSVKGTGQAHDQTK